MKLEFSFKLKKRFLHVEKNGEKINEKSEKKKCVLGY